MFQSPQLWDAVVDAKIEDLYAGTRPAVRPARGGCLSSFIAAARRPIGRAVIAAGARIAGSDGTPARPAAPVHFSA